MPRLTLFLIASLLMISTPLQAKELPTERLQNFLKAFDHLALCTGLNLAYIDNSRTLDVPEKNRQSIRDTANAKIAIYANGNQQVINRLSAPMIAEQPSFASELQQYRGKLISHYRDSVMKGISEGANLTEPQKSCDQLASDTEGHFGTPPALQFTESQAREMDHALASALSDGRCFVVASKAKETYGSDKHGLLLMFDFRRTLSYEYYVTELEDLQPNIDSETLTKIARDQIIPHINEVADYWDAVDEPKRQQWVNHCRQIQKSLQTG